MRQFIYELQQAFYHLRIHINRVFISLQQKQVMIFTLHPTLKL